MSGFKSLIAQPSRPRQPNQLWLGSKYSHSAQLAQATPLNMSAFKFIVKKNRPVDPGNPTTDVRVQLSYQTAQSTQATRCIKSRFKCVTNSPVGPGIPAQCSQGSNFSKYYPDDLSKSNLKGKEKQKKKKNMSTPLLTSNFLCYCDSSFIHVFHIHQSL